MIRCRVEFFLRLPCCGVKVSLLLNPTTRVKRPYGSGRQKGDVLEERAILQHAADGDELRKTLLIDLSQSREYLKQCLCFGCEEEVVRRLRDSTPVKVRSGR